MGRAQAGQGGHKIDVTVAFHFGRELYGRLQILEAGESQRPRQAGAGYGNVPLICVLDSVQLPSDGTGDALFAPFRALAESHERRTGTVGGLYFTLLEHPVAQQRSVRITQNAADRDRSTSGQASITQQLI